MNEHRNTLTKGGVFFMLMCAMLVATDSLKADYLSDLAERIELHNQSWGMLGYDVAAQAAGKTPPQLRIGDRRYTKGLGTHANSEIVVWLAGEYSRFEADVGVQWHPGEEGSVVFQVYVDSEKRFDSGVIKKADAARPVRIPVEGAWVLRLVVSDAGDGILCDGANWADARLIRDPGVKPRTNLEPLDIAPFARVVTSDPNRKDGCRSGRLEEFRSEDLFLEWEIPSAPHGSYLVSVFQNGLGCIGLQWAERRVLSELSLQFADAAKMPSLEGVQVEYWGGIGQTLWQGTWKPLLGKVEERGDRWVFQIDREVPEFRDGSGTHKVRWIFPVASETTVVRGFSAISRSWTRTVELRLELERPMPGKRGEVEVYNGFLVRESRKGSLLRCRWDLAKPLQLKLRYTLRPKLPDRTVLRLRLPGGCFGIAVEDVLANKCVYVRHYGVFVTGEPAKLTLSEYKKEIAGRQTVLERVRQMPDQTFLRAMEKIHDPALDRDPMMLSLACDNEKVVVTRRGVIRCDIVDQEGKAFAGDYTPGSPGWFYASSEIRPRFGLGNSQRWGRGLEDRLPIHIVMVEENGMVYRQRAFVAPFDKESAPGTLKWLNRKPLAVVEFTLENPGAVEAEASLSLEFVVNLKKRFVGYHDEGFCPFQTVSEEPAALSGVENGWVAKKSDGSLLAFVDTSDCASLLREAGNNTITIRGKIPAQGSMRCILYLPRWEMSPEDFTSLKGATELLAEVKAYWKQVLAMGMQVDLPEPLLKDTFVASQMHILLAARNLDNGAVIAPWISSMAYGPLDTEGQAPILAMDLVGYHEFARRCLDCYIRSYNKDGLLVKGYTLMGTGQHLWTLGEHYALARDKEWMKRVAPRVSQACRWIIQQRAKTKRRGAEGCKVPEYGLVPPGVIADWGRYAYYFYLNGYYYAGLGAAARALADVRYPGANALVKEAREFRNEILRAYRWNQARMPALPLSDGTWVPAYPSSLYCFGPTRDFYSEGGVSAIGHDVEVGGNHLVNQGVLDPNGPDARWMTDYMEDTWFADPGFVGFSGEQIQKDWFDLGGFSKIQPYYTRNADIYAMRDDVKPFLRTYFNTFPLMLSKETLAFWEHPHCGGAWNKTHETAWFLEQTRLMMVQERNGELWLAPFVTNNWLKDGMVVGVKDAPTKFGQVSYRIISQVGKGYIEATIDPPTRNVPKALVLRLRHPDGKLIKRVTVNGTPHRRFDAKKECVYLAPARGPVTVRAQY